MYMYIHTHISVFEYVKTAFTLLCLAAGIGICLACIVTGDIKFRIRMFMAGLIGTLAAAMFVMLLVVLINAL